MATLKTRIDDTREQLLREGRSLLVRTQELKLAALEAADDLLAKAQADVHARVLATSAELRRARRASAPRKPATPAAPPKRTKAARARKKTVAFPTAVAA